MRYARSAAELRRVLDESRCGFEVRRVPASAAEDWGLIEGALQHRSRGFFSVVGVWHEAGNEGFVLLHQPQGAVTGLLSARLGGEACYLLQARAEPGCLGEAQFGPTVQSTPANYMRRHGGAATPYVDMFIAYRPDIGALDDTAQLDLGQRYLHKTKKSLLIETSSPHEPEPAYVWATASAIGEAVLESTFLNIDLRSIFSIAAWSGDDSGGALAPRSAEIRRSLNAPIRTELLGRVLFALHAAERRTLRFVPLPSLENWQATEWGWSERRPQQGFRIEFFETKARFREKTGWIQPLVNSASEGEVALACRERSGVVEFFVRVVPEIGLATSAALAPSYVRYPGAREEPPAWLNAGFVWSATTESDEGGRFYRDASRYRIVRVDDAGDAPADGGFWLRLPELKSLLRLSNVCTIQLRGVVSQLLGVT